MRGGNSGVGDAATRAATLSDAEYSAEVGRTARRLQAEREAQEATAASQPSTPKSEAS